MKALTVGEKGHAVAREKGFEVVLPGNRTVEVALALEQVRRIRDEMVTVVAKADAALATLRELGGPEPGAFASRLRVQMNMGAGYFRAAVTDIKVVWKQFNVLRRKKG